jgi:hypothetical protein
MYSCKNFYCYNYWNYLYNVSGDCTHEQVPYTLLRFD